MLSKIEGNPAPCFELIITMKKRLSYCLTVIYIYVTEKNQEPS